MSEVIAGETGVFHKTGAACDQILPQMVTGVYPVMIPMRRFGTK